jgi:hypothetical protein
MIVFFKGETFIFSCFSTFYCFNSRLKKPKRKDAVTQSFYYESVVISIIDR